MASRHEASTSQGDDRPAARSDGRDTQSTAAPDAPDRVIGAREADGEELLALLGDEYARRLLEAISTEARPACELADVCSMSRSTVYRRLNRLAEFGLVSTGVQIEPNGHHRTVFAADLDRVDVAVDDPEPTINVRTGDGPDPSASAVTPAE